MAFFSKDLSELVTRIEERKRKISNMIATLGAQAADLKTQIEDQNGLLVQCELDGDEQGQRVAEKEIKKLKGKLEDLQDKIIAYQKESLKPISANPKEAEKIRQAAIKEQELKSQKVEKLANDKKNIEQQIKDLQIQLEEVKFEYSQALNDESVDRELRKIITSIEPRLNELNGVNRDNAIRVFMRDWLAGTSINEHIYFSVNDSISFVTENPNKPEMDVATMQELNRRSNLEALTDYK